MALLIISSEYWKVLKLQSCKVAKLQNMWKVLIETMKHETFATFLSFTYISFALRKYGIYASQIWCLQGVNIVFVFFNTNTPFY